MPELKSWYLGEYEVKSPDGNNLCRIHNIIWAMRQEGERVKYGIRGEITIDEWGPTSGQQEFILFFLGEGGVELYKSVLNVTIGCSQKNKIFVDIQTTTINIYLESIKAVAIQVKPYQQWTRCNERKTYH
jgi:hypothetical protein